MTVTVNIDPSWFGHPAALAEFLTRVRLLERPAPALSPPREPGDDDEDFGQLLDGIDAPEPAPAPAQAPRPSPPVAKPFDGVPTTGKGLYRWCCDRKMLPRANAVGKSFNYPKLVSDWEPGQVAAAYRILTSEPAPNGKPR